VFLLQFIVDVYHRSDGGQVRRHCVFVDELVRRRGRRWNDHGQHLARVHVGAHDRRVMDRS